MKFALIFAGALALTTTAHAQTVTGIPVDIHSGGTNGHFQVYDPDTQTSTWYGIALSSIPSLAQFGVAQSAFAAHTEVEFDLAGGTPIGCPTEICPSGSAPAVVNVRATWVALPIDGDVTLGNSSAPYQGPDPIMLFGGATPPSGYTVELQSHVGDSSCSVNDGAPAGPGVGFYIQASGTPSPFITPPGYKPIGPVTVYCAPGFFTDAANNGTYYEWLVITARAY